MIHIVCCPYFKCSYLSRNCITTQLFFKNCPQIPVELLIREIDNNTASDFPLFLGSRFVIFPDVSQRIAPCWRFQRTTECVYWMKVYSWWWSFIYHLKYSGFWWRTWKLCYPLPCHTHRHSVWWMSHCLLVHKNLFWEQRGVTDPLIPAVLSPSHVKLVGILTSPKEWVHMNTYNW